MEKFAALQNPDYFDDKRQVERYKYALTAEYIPAVQISKEEDVSHYRFESPTLDFSYSTRPVTMEDEDQRIFMTIAEAVGNPNGLLKDGFEVTDFYQYENLVVNHKASPQLNKYFEALKDYCLIGCNKDTLKLASFIENEEYKFMFLKAPIASGAGMMSLAHEVGHLAHRDQLTEEEKKLKDACLVAFRNSEDESGAFLGNQDYAQEVIGKYNYHELLEDKEKNKEAIEKIRREAIGHIANKSFTQNKDARKWAASITLEDERAANAFALKFFKNTANDLGISIEDVQKDYRNSLKQYSMTGEDILPEKYYEWD